MTGWIVLAAVAPVVIAVMGYFGKRLVDKNDAAHDRLWGVVEEVRSDVGELKVGQGKIEAKIDMLIQNGKSDG